LNSNKEITVICRFKDNGDDITQFLKNSVSLYIEREIRENVAERLDFFDKQAL
jgi:hypothetical protein